MSLEGSWLVLLLLGVSSATSCPDGRKCQGNEACCTSPDGTAACCPPAHAVLCPDQESECPDETTCCHLPDQTWGCCPMAKAVCCEDKQHCCPEGTQCDLSHSRCVSAGLGFVPMLEKLPARRKPVVVGRASETCPGGKGHCPEGSTCCLLRSGDYGCCPFPEAVCCSDLLHCCPANTTCDLERARCLHGAEAFPLATKISARPNDVVCPDSSTMCPEQTMVNGSYGCCPMPNAKCCSDQLHCCPEGYSCDLVYSICVSTDTSLPLLTYAPAKTSSAVAKVKAQRVPCNESVACADDTTCCQTTAGVWACCPMPKAVCCQDHVHCCPHGTICNVAQARCDDARGHAPSVPWLNKLPVLSLSAGEEVAMVTAQRVPCNESVACADDTTCCQTTAGVWACCPMPKAVCCQDHVHCCPHGTICNVAQARCDDARGHAPSVPWLNKLPVLSLSAGEEVAMVTAQRVPCNESVACADDTTCCQTTAGVWACCPMPKAVCCQDHVHCCPHGTICNVAQARCDDARGHAPSVPWLNKLPVLSLSAGEEVAMVTAQRVPCNESVACADDTTCCQTTAGVWACCPMPKAVCCQDHVHCCPHGTICNVAQARCDDARGNAPSVPWLNKLPVLSLSAGEEVAMVTSSDEKCDRQTKCPGGTTCCRKDSGDWACCPLPQAVCCDDQEHCCPEGSRCNPAQQRCDGPGSGSLPWVRRTPALPRADPEPSLDRLSPARVKCDARTYCPRDTTCCFMESSGLWGCCPVPKAVCCADGEHCCPDGYVCDPRTASCSKRPAAGLQRLPWFSKESAMQHGVQRAMLGDVKCDNASSCASGTTCCKLASGDWGCCPLVKAVCCDDHEHCCPQGYTCNMHSGTCEKQLQHPSPPQSKVVWSALRRSAPEEDVPCDAVGAFRCSKQETCCRTSATEWACCPSAQAVCCADSQHCCPAGSSCDQAAGGCTPRSKPSRPPQRWDAEPFPLEL